MKSNNNTVKNLALALLLVVVVGFTGISFAYFTVDRISNPNAVGGKASTNGPKISLYEETTGITLDSMYPVPDELGKSSSHEYSFRVRNEENKNITSKIILEVEDGSTLDDSLVSISLNGVVYTLGNLSKVDSSQGYKSSYLVTSIPMSGGETVKNSLRVWVNENGKVENAQNKTWSSRIQVIPEFN